MGVIVLNCIGEMHIYNSVIDEIVKQIIQFEFLCVLECVTFT